MGRRYLLLGLVTAGWGTIPVLAGWSHLPAGLVVAFRLWTAALCLAVVLLVERRRTRWGRHGVVVPSTAGPSGTGSSSSGPSSTGPKLLSIAPGRCCLTAAVLGLHWLALFAAYQRAPAGTVILIVYLAPIGVAGLAPHMLGESLGRRTVLALGAALAGFALLAGPTVRSAGASGLTFSLLAAVLFVALIVLSKPLATSYGGLRLAFMELAGAGVLVIPVALTTHWPPIAVSWLWIVVIGMVHTALGITLYLSVLADIPATHVAILSYLEPVVVVLAAWLWLGQRPGPATVAGGVLVVAAGVALAVSAAAPTGPTRRHKPSGAGVGCADPAIPSL